MGNDWMLVWDFLKNCPVEIYILFSLIAVLLTWGVYLQLSMSRTVSYQWYDHWVKKIDGHIRDVRKQHKRRDREDAYRDAFAKLWAELEVEVGDDFNFMNTAQRSVWIHLATRQRDIMRFY